MGLPTGKSFAHGDQAYNLSFWGINHRTEDGRYFQVPFMSGWGGNTLFLAPNGLSTFVFTDYGPDSYSLAIPQFTEDLLPYPEGGLSPSTEYALVMKGVWLIPEHYKRAVLINSLLLAWIGLVTGSVILLLTHLFRSSQAARGSLPGWLFLTLLAGPLGLWIYWRRVRRRSGDTTPVALATR